MPLAPTARLPDVYCRSAGKMLRPWDGHFGLICDFARPPEVSRLPMPTRGSSRAQPRSAPNADRRFNYRTLGFAAAINARQADFYLPPPAITPPKIRPPAQPPIAP